MFDSPLPAAKSRAKAGDGALQMWAFHARATDGFYGTSLLALAETRDEAAARLASQAKESARADLKAFGFAYGMDAQDPDLERLLTRRWLATHAEALENAQTLAEGAFTISTPHRGPR